MFDTFSQIFNDGLVPCMKMYIDFLLDEGMFLGVGILVLPLVGRILNIFKNLFH